MEDLKNLIKSQELVYTKGQEYTLTDIPNLLTEDNLYQFNKTQLENGKVLVNIPSDLSKEEINELVKKMSKMVKNYERKQAKKLAKKQQNKPKSAVNREKEIEEEVLEFLNETMSPYWQNRELEDLIEDPLNYGKGKITKRKYLQNLDSYKELVNLVEFSDYLKELQEKDQHVFAKNLVYTTKNIQLKEKTMTRFLYKYNLQANVKVLSYDEFATS